MDTNVLLNLKRRCEMKQSEKKQRIPKTVYGKGGGNFIFTLRYLHPDFPPRRGGGADMA